VDDVAAGELLDHVTEAWVAQGVLIVLRDLVQQVWRTDLARHDETLGDDAMSLGMQASRNLCNLAVRRLHDVPGVVARDRRTLEVTYADRVLHVGKAPSDSPSWEVDQVDWADSDVREQAAIANTAAYQSTVGTLFEDWDEPLPGPNRDPSALRHLHLTWQGLADGRTRIWLGFPQLGSRPWYAVRRLDEPMAGADSTDATGPTAPNDPTGPTGAGTDPVLPYFDRLGEPDVPVSRRAERPRRQGAAG
jgi:hypothetical protein